MGTFTLVVSASTNGFKPTIAIIETDGSGTAIADGGGMGRCLVGPFHARSMPYQGETKLVITDMFGNKISVTDSELDPVTQLTIGGVDMPMASAYLIWKQMQSYLPTSL